MEALGGDMCVQWAAQYHTRNAVVSAVADDEDF